MSWLIYLNLCLFGILFFMLLLSSADILKNHFFFSKNYFRITVRVSNGLDPDQDICSVGPDLGPNCLQTLSADDKGGC